MFDSLMDTSPTSFSDDDELQRYLATDVEDVKDGLMWWYDKRAIFPRLSRMARGYLSIPGEYLVLSYFSSVLKHLSIATTVDVERVFSRARLILPYVRNSLGVQSTRASLCVGLWSSQGLIKDGDIKASLGADDDREEDELPVNWDAIPVL